MKTFNRYMSLQANKHHPTLRIKLSVLTVMVFSSVARAEPPAKTATCEGIKEAYTVLGTQCENTYELVNHNPTNAAERQQSYTARKTVLQIFQKALLCNGMYGATSAQQDRFKSGEAGHLQALEQLQQAMTNAGDPNVPETYTATLLKNDIKMTKQQCK